MDEIPDSPLSNEEIRELDVFLMSDATPDECMDIVTLLSEVRGGKRSFIGVLRRLWRRARR